MRILFVVHQFYPEYAGGTEKVCYQLAKAAQRAGHYVRVLTCRVDHWTDDSGESLVDSVYQGIPLSIFQRKELPEDADIDLPVVPELAQSIKELLEQEQYDIAHVLHTMRMGSALEAIASVGIPYVVTITDFFAQCFRINLVNIDGQLCDGASGGKTCAVSCNISSWTEPQLLERSVNFRQVLSGATERICPSLHVKNKFSTEYPELSFRVIEHGIDLNKAIQQKEQYRESIEDSEALIIGFVGSFVPAKGLECLIKAFCSVTSSDVRLHLYGGFFGADDYRDKISDLVDADERISLRPFVEADRIFSVLMGFDVFCLPSIVPETFSLIVREAAAAGTPVLVSDLGAPADYVHQHACGEVLSAGDASVWALAMEKVVSKPEILNHWKKNLPLPDRLEEEAFYYQSLYRKSILNDRGLTD